LTAASCHTTVRLSRSGAGDRLRGVRPSSPRCRRPLTSATTPLRSLRPSQSMSRQSGRGRAGHNYKLYKRPATFMCPVQGCGSTFTRSFNLRGHIQSHNAGSLFLCKWPECGKGFTVWDAGRSRAARAPAYVPETLPVMNMKQSSWRPRKGDPCLFNLLVKYKERHAVEVHPEKTSDSDLACCCLIMITPCKR
jgi:hypothetical protein